MRSFGLPRSLLWMDMCLWPGSTPGALELSSSHAGPVRWSAHDSTVCALRPGGPGMGWALGRADLPVTGVLPTGPDRELQTVRRTMINFLQNHTDGNRPPACPSLDPIRCVLLWKRQHVSS